MKKTTQPTSAKPKKVLPKIKKANVNAKEPKYKYDPAKDPFRYGVGT